MRATRIVLMAAGLGALAGCSDFSFVDDEGYDQRLEDSLERVELIEEAGFTDPSTLPTSGSAQYDGTAIIKVEDEDSYTLAGDLELEVGFADSGSVSGTIDGLIDEDDEAYEGAITMTGGSIDRDATGTATLDPTFAVELGGSIETPDGTAYDVDEGSVALGDFYGDDYVFGGMAGDLCTATEECVEFGGSFDAER